MQKERIIYLLERYADNMLTAAEEKELRAFLSDGNLPVEQVSALVEEYASEPFATAPAALQPLIDRIVAVDRPKKEIPVAAPHRLLHMRWLRYAAVAILTLGVGAYIYIWEPREIISATATSPALPAPDIPPGKEGAVLTLADGSTILLDSMQNGVVAHQKGTEIELIDGLLTYSAREAAGPVSYNTMSTPNGRQFALMLPDGSRVWLNAASSITYPTSFAGNDRRVSITGEAYFEVVSDPQKPFKVKAGDKEVVVTGTSFNVNGYIDEAYTRITLLEGIVKIDNKTLSPGQAYVNGEIVKADVEQAVAWKDRVFNFDKMPIDAAMRQISRWYDITVEYEHGIPNINVGGAMGMDLTLSQMLSILSDMQLKYRLEGRKLIIL